MAISSFATWRIRSESPDEQIHYVEQIFNGIFARLYSFWVGGPNAGIAPTTAVVPSRTLAGAFGQKDGVGNLVMADLKILTGMFSGGGVLILVDRLSHQGGLDATVTSAQTTNLPTAALTRYTTGAGVFAAFEIYTQIGATGTTITVSYTNQAGTAGQTSTVTAFGATNYREAARLIQIPLALGDSGVRSVESVTVLASTLTAGNFGITLYKPLYVIPIKGDFTPTHFNSLIQGANQASPILSGACLHWIAIPGSNSFGALQGIMNLVDA